MKSNFISQKCRGGQLLHGGGGQLLHGGGVVSILYSSKTNY